LLQVVLPSGLATSGGSPAGRGQNDDGAYRFPYFIAVFVFALPRMILVIASTELKCEKSFA